MENVFVYDIEIKLAVPPRSGDRLGGVSYCDGWHDHKNMGIACIGAYSYREDRTRVFMEDNIDDFFHACDEHDLLVGFNNIAFDNSVINAPDPRLTQSDKFYDVLVEIWAGLGFGATFNSETHAGYGLDAMARANIGSRKTGNGAFAPVDYQRGRYGTLIDYCLNDVSLTKRLFDRVLRDGFLLSPKTGDRIAMRNPGAK